ncbi:MAG: hypothetical protein J0H82_05005 [Alphaproteobacteria bacterium]|nr:hypothetical protein [Alphaproteobacteria bacterium]
MKSAPAVVVMLALAGHAAGAEPPRPQPRPSGPVFMLNRGDCERIGTVYRPAPDVAYKPGVDVHGRPVAPADLPNGYEGVLPDQIVIPLTVPLRRYAPQVPAVAGSEIYAGAVTLDLASGKLFLNGRPLEPDDGQALAAACATLRRR